LETVALAADAIAADARFNLRVADLKRTSDALAVKLIDPYEDLVARCMSAVSNLGDNGDQAS
jgi:hypothetical protein